MPDGRFVRIVAVNPSQQGQEYDEAYVWDGSMERAVGPREYALECPRNISPVQASSFTANVCLHGWRSSGRHLR
jgi:hypothetical protein